MDDQTYNMNDAPDSCAVPSPIQPLDVAQGQEGEQNEEVEWSRAMTRVMFNPNDHFAVPPPVQLEAAPHPRWMRAPTIIAVVLLLYACALLPHFLL